MARKLYEIVSEVENVISESIDRETGELAEGAFEKLEALNIEAKDKLYACSEKLRELKAQSSDCDERMKAIRNVKKSLDSNVESLEGYIIENMTKLGYRGFIHNGSKLTIRKSPMSVHVESFESLHPRFIQESVTLKALKSDIKNYIKNTGDVPEGVTVVDNKVYLKLD